MMYELSDVKQTYTNKPVLDISKLNVKEGEVLGVVGSNGSGKSTLLRHLAFLENIQSGTLLYKKFDYKNIPLSVKREISILLSEPYLLKRSVKENLLFGLKSRNKTKNTAEKIDEVLKLVDLKKDKFLHRNWYELSSGEAQRVALAARLILKPKMLLLDEPTNSLDFSGTLQFKDALLFANKELGTTLIIATHDLPWLNSLSARKIGLHFGRVVDFSTTNIILGRWESKEDEQVYTFSDKQTMSVSKEIKIGEKRGIAINPKEIKIANSEYQKKAHEISLKGTIKEVTLLSQSDEISIKVMIGTHVLEIVLPYHEFAKRKAYPSQNVTIYFDKSSLKSV